MNKGQRDNLYITAMYKLLFEQENSIVFDNGDILGFRANQTQYPNHSNSPEKAMSLEITIQNMDGKTTYLGDYYKRLDNYQKQETIFNLDKKEKVAFILKSEEGFLKKTPYHLVEHYGGKISKFTSDTIQDYAKSSLEKMKLELKEKAKQMNKK